MIDLRIAIRNLLRNRRRSFATFFALAIGTASILLFGGFTANIKYSMQTAYIRSGGHLQVQHRDFLLYGNGSPAAYGIANYREIIAAIQADDSVGKSISVVTPTLQFGGIAGNYAAGASRTVVGLGLVAADHSRMLAWNEFGLPLIHPPFALDGAAQDAAIVGIGVARVLQLCDALKVPDCPKPPSRLESEGRELPADIAELALGEKPAEKPAAATVSGGSMPRIELLASSSGGTPNVVSVEVIRAELQGFKELDEIYVVLQLSQAQRLIFGRAPPEATAILVQLSRTANMNSAEEQLTQLLARVAPGQPLAVLDFEELNPFFVQTIAMFDMFFGFIFALIATIVLFTVSNTMNTAVVERTVEIGTVRAMGLRRSGIGRLFVLEGALLGVSGAVTGALFALAAAAVVNAIGLTWLPPGSADRLPLVLLVWHEKAMMLGTTIGLSAIATLSAWWPAHRASRLAIVDALRHV
jgi:putative ABC transport system permease protein